VKNRSLFKLIAVAVVLLGAGLAPLPHRFVQLRVGSKKFTESVILGEMMRLVAEDAGLEVAHYREFGGTRIVFDALAAGEIDLYPEYTGTITAEILAGQNVPDERTMRELLRQKGIGVSKSLGFSDTYALALTRRRATQLGISRISDLTRLPESIMTSPIASSWPARSTSSTFTRPTR
jgi:osmoprotectant transport system permease protein